MYWGLLNFINVFLVVCLFEFEGWLCRCNVPGGQSIVGRQRRQLNRLFPVFLFSVVIPEHVTSNASDSESSYRKCDDLPATMTNDHPLTTSETSAGRWLADDSMS